MLARERHRCRGRTACASRRSRRQNSGDQRHTIGGAGDIAVCEPTDARRALRSRGARPASRRRMLCSAAPTSSRNGAEMFAARRPAVPRPAGRNASCRRWRSTRGRSGRASRVRCQAADTAPPRARRSRGRSAFRSHGMVSSSPEMRSRSGVVIAMWNHAEVRQDRRRSFERRRVVSPNRQAIGRVGAPAVAVISKKRTLRWIGKTPR